jgi:chromosome partitioning protein
MTTMSAQKENRAPQVIDTSSATGRAFKQPPRAIGLWPLPEGIEASGQSNTRPTTSESAPSSADIQGGRRAQADGAPALRQGRGTMKIIACVGKGGGGKTTTTINLAVIARRLGRKVGVIDADPQASTYEWRCARGTGDIPVVRCRPNELDAAIDCAVRAGIDVLFCDMPPDPTLAQVVLQRIDLALIATRPTFFDLKVTWPYIELLRSGKRLYGIIINAAPPMRQGEDAPMVRDARQALAAAGKALWSRQITQRHAIPYAVIAGRGVIETEPDGPAALEYRALWNVVARSTQIRRSLP